MASTFTTNKNIEKPGYTDYASDPTGWTAPVNGDWDTIDRAFGGTHPVSLTGSNVTLTAIQCQNARILLTGALSANLTIFFPAGISGLFVVDNATTGSFVITLASVGAGPESVIAVQNANTLVWLDSATNSVYLADNSPVTGGIGLTVSGTTIDLDVPVTVPNGGTGQTSYLPGQLLIGNSAGGLTPATITPGSNISIVNGNGAITISATGTAGGVTTFSGGTTGLTPNTATAGAVTLSGTLGVANGGTGATTTAGALTAIGGVAAGAYTAANLTLASSRLLGRTSGGTGAAEEIAIGSGLTLSGGTLAASAVVCVVTSVAATSSASGFSLSSSGSTAVTVSFGISSTASAQASLGLGTMATQAANSVAITGGSITGLSSLRTSGASYDLAANGTLNVTASTSFFASGTGLTHSASGVGNFATTTSTFTLQSGITPQAFGTTTWTNISDNRIKKNLAPYTLGLDNLKQLQTVTYQFNGLYGSSDDGKINVGLIAQDVAETSFYSMVEPWEYIDPTTGDITHLLSVNTSQLVFALINAVKELSARVEVLEAK